MTVRQGGSITFAQDFGMARKSIPTILTTSQKHTGVDAERGTPMLMQPINTIIEFKQIIGRGTRYAGKESTSRSADFVKAHQHFSDPEWDGEPLEPEHSEACKEMQEVPGTFPCRRAVWGVWAGSVSM
ncbi:MAG: hypothetical protein U0903_01710 [Planctomycetales bacterium]